MKASETTKAFFFWIILIILTSGCASTTLFQTSPDGADIYVNGQKQGLTPYKYSDKKIAFSSTPITFKKDGYHDLNIILKRDERPDIGALIGGVTVYVPFLWFMKYDPLHHYDLERTNSVVKEDGIIYNLNNDTVSVTDTIFGKHKIISNRDSIPADDLTGLKPDNSGNQTDSHVNDHKQKFIFHFGIGGGFGLMSKGRDTVLVDRNIAGLLGMHFTFILPGNWGGNISCKGNITKSKDVPSDYYDDGARVFSPKDYFNMISVNLIKEFSISDESVRIGLEAGPSWVSYSKAEFQPNPNYHPSDEESSWWFSTYKYYKSHSRIKTVGVSLGVKTRFQFIPLIGTELEAFTIINKIKPTTGFMFHLFLGNLKLNKFQ